MNNKKTLIVIAVDNHIDLITNSSSELFVLQGDTQDTVEEMIKAVYPDYLNEYEYPECLRDAEPETINSYLSWVEHGWYRDYEAKRGMTDEEERKYDIKKAEEKAAKYGMSPAKFYKDWASTIIDKWFYPRISEEGLRTAAKQLDPDGKIFLLYSIDENPDWEMQEALSSIGTRYHLG